MKPIVLITVYHRYYEFQKNVERVWSLAGEFRQPPDVVVVWSKPEEVGRLWLFQRLLKEGKITHLLMRYPKTKKSISYEESHNIHFGLNFIKEQYKNTPHFIIGQTADIWPQQNIYGWIESLMETYDAVLFFMENQVCRENVWYTSFYAVRDEKYWPPFLEEESPDILEVIWGRQLVQRGADNFFRSHNYNGKRFLNYHLSEELPNFPIESQTDDGGVNLFIRGYIPFGVRLKNLINWSLSWLKWW